MKKFKQICVISFLVLLFAVAITCLVVYWVNPQLLKDTFEYGKTILDHPLPIVGVSIGVFCFTLFQIFSHTSFGKAIYNKAEEKTNVAIQKTEKLKEEAKAYYEEAQKLKSDTIAVLNEFSNKYDNLSNQIITVCETSPNARIRELGKSFAETQDNAKVEISAKVEELSKNFNIKEQATLEELNEKYNKLLELLEAGKENEQE